MKLIGAAIAALTIALLATAATAQKIELSGSKLDLSAVKCQEFVGSDKETIGLILMWLEGYYHDEDAPPIVDFDNLKTMGEKLGAYCGKNPMIGLMTAADEALKK